MLTAVVCAALLVMALGAALTATIAVALAFGAIGGVVRQIRYRRDGRLLDRGSFVQSFALSWAVWAGAPELLPFNIHDGPVTRVLLGLSFAVFVTVIQFVNSWPLGPSRGALRDADRPDPIRSS